MDRYIIKDVDWVELERLRDKYASEHPSTDTVFCKVKWKHDFDYMVEVNCLTKLQDSEFTPKIYSHTILAEISDNENTYYIVLIEMERLEGDTLTELYILDDLIAKYGMGPGGYILPGKGVDIETIKRYIPLEYIPLDIFNQVVDILTTLYDKYKICYQDIHTSNFIVYQDKVYIVDFDYAEFA